MKHPYPYPGAGYRPGRPEDHEAWCGCSSCCWAKSDRLVRVVGYALGAVVAALLLASALVTP